MSATSAPVLFAPRGERKLDSATNLPFLFVHGDWIWKVGVAACGVLGALLALSLRAVLARARMRAELEAMKQRTASDEVRGTLRGAAARANAVVAQTISADPVNVQVPRGHAHVRDKGLALHAEDGRVIELVGPVHVFASAESTLTRGGIPEVVSDDDFERAKESIPWIDRNDTHTSAVHDTTLHPLRDGEEVIVRGALTSTASTEESAFRNANVRWTMQGDNGPLAACARKPRAVRLPRAFAPPIAAAVVFALLGFAAQSSLGEKWAPACHSERSSLPFDNWHPCVKTAATSVDRGRALRQMSISLRASFERSGPGFQQMIAAVRFAEGCGAALQILRAYERYEQAASLARECGARRALHQALVDLGRFEEAAQIVVAAEPSTPALPTLSTLILAGLWREAAAELDRHAAELATSDLSAMTVAGVRCHAMLLRHYANDPSALPALREAQRSGASAECLPMLIEASDEAERHALLASVDGDAKDLLSAEGRRVLAMQQALDERLDWPKLRDEPELELTRPRSLNYSSWVPMLWAVKLTSRPPSQPSRFEYLRWRTLAHLVDDEDDAAERTAGQALVLLPPTLHELDTARYLLSVVRYFQGSTDFPLDLPQDKELSRYFAGKLSALLMRKGTLNDDSLIRASERSLESLFAEALRGDATALAKQIRELGYTPYLDDAFLAALPRITKGREELAQMLIWNDRRSVMTLRWPFFIAARHFARREVLQAAGATAEAKSADDIYRRFDAALSDRRRLISAAMLELTQAGFDL